MSSSQTPPVMDQGQQKQGPSALKIVLIVVGVLVALGVLGMGIVGYGVYRVAHNIKKDLNGDKVSMNLPGGQMTAETGAMSEADLGVPVYPGAEPSGKGAKLNLGKGPVATQTFMTGDDQQKVVDFYKDKLGAGAVVTPLPGGAILSLNRGESESVTVNVSQRDGQNDGKTRFSIMHASVSK